jgi:hypothetical protein
MLRWHRPWLRSSASASTTNVSKQPSELDRHAKILYEWLDTSKVSRVRMMVNWQAMCGLSFVAQTHHRAAQCFVYHGNSGDDGTAVPVTLQEFQGVSSDVMRMGRPVSGMTRRARAKTSRECANRAFADGSGH